MLIVLISHNCQANAPLNFMLMQNPFYFNWSWFVNFVKILGFAYEFCLMKCLSLSSPLLSNGGLFLRAVVGVGYACSCMAYSCSSHSPRRPALWLKVLKGSPSRFNFMVFLGVTVNLMLSTMLI